MATLAFIMHFHTGHLIATFGLAKNLKQAGHRIFYLSILDRENFIIDQGFEFFPILEDTYPKESVVTKSKQDEKTNKEKNKPKKNSKIRNIQFTLNALREETIKYQGLVDFLSKKKLDKALEIIKPDLVLADYDIPQMALAVYQAGFPVIQIIPNFVTTRAPNVPPSSTAIVPSHSTLSKLNISFSWYKLLLIKSLLTKILELFGVVPAILSELKKTAAQCNFPLEKIDNNTSFFPVVKMPLLILCPQELDFPRELDQDNHYLGYELVLSNNSVEKDPFPWEKLDPKKTLVYCSLCSDGRLTKKYKQLSQMAIDAISTMPDKQLVMSIGLGSKIEDFQNIPPNVILSNWVPQKEMLKKISMMITTGGSGTVNDCVSSGIPMIVIPSIRDHPGNGARVVYHKIGLMGNPQNMSSKEMALLIDTIDKDPGFKQRAETMRKKILEKYSPKRKVEIVESYIKNKFS